MRAVVPETGSERPVRASAGTSVRLVSEADFIDTDDSIAVTIGQNL